MRLICKFVTLLFPTKQFIQFIQNTSNFQQNHYSIIVNDFLQPQTQLFQQNLSQFLHNYRSIRFRLQQNSDNYFLFIIMKSSVILTLIVSFLAICFFRASILSQQQQNMGYPDLDFVKGMDFQKFMGLWYNIASLPNAIQRGCKCPQSFDTLASDLVIELQESCLIFGKNITSKSKAVAKTYGFGDWTNWNGPLQAPYWIIKLDTDYKWVVIGQPSRKGFWIMSRTPKLNKNIVDELIAWGIEQQFDLSGIQYADQSCFTDKDQEGGQKVVKNLSIN